MDRSKAVLITGASSGIGKACALHLDKLGYRVFAGLRKPKDAEALLKSGSEHLTPVILDVTNSDQIASALQSVTEALGGHGLAGLINNAGIAKGGPLEFIPIEDLRLQLEVNVIGQVAVTQAFLPLIRLGQGRVINMSSISGRVALPLIGPYCASKFALEALTDALRLELAPWNIAVVSIQPGPIDTPIWDKSITDFDQAMSSLPEEANRLYGAKLTAQRKNILRAAESGIPPAEVVKAVIHALTAKRPKARYLIGSQAKKGALIKKWLPEKLWDWLLARART